MFLYAILLIILELESPIILLNRATSTRIYIKLTAALLVVVLCSRLPGLLVETDILGGLVRVPPVSSMTGTETVVVFK